MRALEALAALFVTALPSRYWRRFDWMPLHRAHPVSGLIVLLAGVALGIRGYAAYVARTLESSAASILAVATEQAAGRLPETAAVSGAPGAVMILSAIAYVCLTPTGVASAYLVASGGFRIAGWWVGEPHGDPLLTGLDGAFRRGRRASAERAAHAARLEAEGPEEPDRLYEGAWAGLPDAEFVVVAARRKPGWHEGTFVMTPERWFTLGKPFDRRTPAGLRTFYPLITQTGHPVLRTGVSYELPALRPSRGRKLDGPDPSKVEGGS